MHRSSRLFSASAALVCAALVGAAFSPSAAAHHSLAAMYDMAATREIEGRVAKIHWMNPHVRIYVTARDGQTWEIEAGAVSMLSRMGIEKHMLKVGETVSVYGNPGRHNARTLLVSNILLPNRTELLAGPDAKPHWSKTKAVGRTDQPTKPGEPVTDGKRTFFRVWSTLIPVFPKPRGEAVLTDAGRKAQARYGIDKQVVADCDVPGMPFAMMSPYPMAIEQKGDQLIIRGEAYDLMRVVHPAAPARPPAPSPLGLSVGRIKGNELTIETSRINYHSYGDLGPAQSAQSHVVERFTLSANGLTLEYDITVTDPVMLGKPWSWGGTFYAWKDAAIRPWNCGIDRG